MKLGILINTDRHLKHLIKISRAASNNGHNVSLFAMDAGTKLLQSDEFPQLCKLENLMMSVCNHSATEHEVETAGVSKEIVIGSQFNNAMMNNQSDKVIVL